MNIRFNTILIPVDFSKNTEIAAKKALALCEGSNVSIHLLHVSAIPGATIISPYQFFARYSSGKRQLIHNELERKMWELQWYIKSKNKDAEICTWISYDKSVEKVIVEKAQRIGADLLVIGKNSHHSWFPFLNTVNPVNIAKKSGIAVLTVKPGSATDQIRTIVVPVEEKFPEHAVAVIHTLQKKIRIRVRLLSFFNKNNEGIMLSASLLNVYRTLKTSPALSVSYEVLHSQDKSKTIFNYCKKVDADLLIIDHDVETRGLSFEGTTPVLAIQPV